jgi:hypothetical protein
MDFEAGSGGFPAKLFTFKGVREGNYHPKIGRSTTLFAFEKNQPFLNPMPWP